jgi:hypothetical protein
LKRALSSTLARHKSADDERARFRRVIGLDLELTVVDLEGTHPDLKVMLVDLQVLHVDRRSCT